jgi:toxin YoeB
LSRSKKQAKSSEPTSPTCFFPVFSSDFKADLRWWYRQEPKKADSPMGRPRQRIMDLVADILDGDPFNGLGKPEPLKYFPEANTWSRRIDLEHRLTYQIDQNRIVFLQARYHYEDS